MVAVSGVVVSGRGWDTVLEVMASCTKQTIIAEPQSSSSSSLLRLLLVSPPRLLLRPRHPPHPHPLHRYRISLFFPSSLIVRSALVPSAFARTASR
jgi:hypothetical protein